MSGLGATGSSAVHSGGGVGGLRGSWSTAAAAAGVSSSTATGGASVVSSGVNVRLMNNRHQNLPPPGPPHTTTTTQQTKKKRQTINPALTTLNTHHTQPSTNSAAAILAQVNSTTITAATSTTAAAVNHTPPMHDTSQSPPTNSVKCSQSQVHTPPSRQVNTPPTHNTLQSQGNTPQAQFLTSPSSIDNSRSVTTHQTSSSSTSTSIAAASSSSSSGPQLPHSPFRAGTPQSELKSDYFSESALLGSDHEWIYNRSPAEPTLPIFDQITKTANLPISPITTANAVHMGSTTSSLTGIGQYRSEFKTPIACSIFNDREGREGARDGFMNLVRKFKSTNVFGSTSTSSSSTTSIEQSITEFLNQRHPVNFFWFSLFFVDQLLEECGLETSSSVITGGKSTSQNLERLIQLNARLIGAPVTQDGMMERKQSGAGLPINASPNPTAIPANITPRRTPSTRSLGRMNSSSMTTSSSSSATNRPSPSYSSPPVSDPLRAPHLTFSFTTSSLSATSSELASLFPDRQEFFARFLLVAVDHGRLCTQLKYALVMKLHQLSDLSENNSNTGLTGDSSGWKFSEPAATELVRTWHVRIMKLRLLSKFLSFLSILPDMDLTRVGQLGGKLVGTNEMGQPIYEPFQLMLNIMLNTASARNTLTFPPFQSSSINESDMQSPVFIFPLYSYLVYGRSSDTLALFIPWICSYLRLFKFDQVQLQTDYYQLILQELADIFRSTKKKIQEQRDHQSRSSMIHPSQLQRTHSSPMITPTTFRSVTNLSPTIQIDGPYATTTASPHTIFGQSSMTPLSTPSISPLPPNTNTSLPDSNSRPLTTNPTDDLNTSFDSSYTDVTAPSSPRLDSSMADSPLLVPNIPFSPQPTFPSTLSSHMNTTSPNRLHPTSSHIRSAAGIIRTQSFLLFEIEDLFEWLELNIDQFRDEFDQRKKRKEVNRVIIQNRIKRELDQHNSLSTLIDSPVSNSLPVAIPNRIPHPSAFSPQTDSRDHESVLHTPPRVQPRSLLPALDSSTSNTNTINHAPFQPSRSASTVLPQKSLQPTTASPNLTFTSSPSPLPQLLSTSLTPLDLIPNLIPNTLFLSLLTSTLNPTRQDEILAIFDPLNQLGGRKESSANNLENPSSDNSLAPPIPQPTLKRLASVNGVKRKIKPIVDPSAAALEKLRSSFFKSHPELSKLTRFISDQLEPHIKDGYTIKQALIIERCQINIDELEKSVEQELSVMELSKDNSAVESFLRNLHIRKQALIQLTFSSLNDTCLVDLKTYLSHNSLQTLLALGSPHLDSSVKETASHLVTLHSFNATHSHVSEKLRMMINQQIEKWFKKWILVIQQRTRKLQDQTTIQLTSATKQTNPVNEPSMTEPIPGLPHPMTQELNIRVANARQCCRDLLNDLSLLSTPSPVTHTEPLMNQIHPIQLTRRLLQVLMPLTICVKANQITPPGSLTQLFIPISYQPFFTSTSSNASDSSIFDSVDSSTSNLFLASILVLRGLHRLFVPSTPSTSAITSHLPNEYDQCWFRLTQIYEKVTTSEQSSNHFDQLIQSIQLEPDEATFLARLNELVAKGSTK